MGCERDHELILACPRCESYACGICGTCSTCGNSLHKIGRIIDLVEECNSFYEGVYQSQTHFNEAALDTLRGQALLPFITFGYLQAIVKHVPKGTQLLELGCGSGLQLTASRYTVTAVELSMASLCGTPEGYRHLIHGDVTSLDFRPGTFDAIAASCFWEHFTAEQKQGLLEKFIRWLRPGGRLILLFDTASQNPFFRRLRRHPGLFQRCFVDHDGHVGLETVSINRERFERYGFEQVAGIGLNRTFQHLPVLSWVAPYSEVSRLAHFAALFGAAMERSPHLSQAFTGALHLWDLTVGRVFPLDWSRLYLGVWRKG